MSPAARSRPLQTDVSRLITPSSPGILRLVLTFADDMSVNHHWLDDRLILVAVEIPVVCSR